MLSDQLGEVRGEVSGFRVLKTEAGPRVETNFEGSGTFCDKDVTEIVTYWATPRMDGSFYGGADGMIVTADVQNALYTGNGVGRMKGNNLAAEWRGALYYQSFSPAFASLNALTVVFEFEIEPNGKSMVIRTWGWK
ncbi:MAG TPA: hypothetical protein VHT30_13255 [Acidimicrobiales bacterium]|jgi:hypothetical protein|nr:hypothetical protein [Acidimicrobiales bacterium]